MGKASFLENRNLGEGRTVEVSEKATKAWASAYRYYAQNLKDDDVIVKMDDDIVYTSGLRHYMDYLQCNAPNSIVFPNIINNDIALIFQLLEGALNTKAKNCVLKELLSKFQDSKIHPGTVWSAGSYPFSKWNLAWPCAKLLHDDFLENPKRYQTKTVITWSNPQRMTINMFGFAG